MPLRDHFHPPLSRTKNGEGFHGLWPGSMTVQLNELLPARFEAEPSVHVGSEIERKSACFSSTRQQNGESFMGSGSCRTKCDNISVKGRHSP
jgi:hypothetical protein